MITGLWAYTSNRRRKGGNTAMLSMPTVLALLIFRREAVPGDALCRGRPAAYRVSVRRGAVTPIRYRSSEMIRVNGAERFCGKWQKANPETCDGFRVCYRTNCLELVGCADADYEFLRQSSNMGCHFQAGREGPSCGATSVETATPMFRPAAPLPMSLARQTDCGIYAPAFAQMEDILGIDACRSSSRCAQQCHERRFDPPVIRGSWQRRRCLSLPRRHTRVGVDIHAGPSAQLPPILRRHCHRYEQRDDHRK